MNQELIYILLLIMLGYVLKRMQLLKETDGAVISRIIFNVTLPSLMIVTFHSVKIDSSLMMLPGTVILFGLFSLLLAFFLFRKEEKEWKGTIMMIVAGYNVGLFAFPIVEAIWGTEGLTYFGMFDAGNAILIFGISYIIASYYSSEGLVLTPTVIVKRLGKSVPLMTYIIVIILNLSHIKLPSGVIDLASILSRANMPLALLLLGIYLNFTFDKQYIRLIKKFLFYRYGLGLLFGLSFYFFAPVDSMFKNTILLGSILPIGLAAIPYTVEFNYSTARFIGIISNISIVISMVLLILFAAFIF